MADGYLRISEFGDRVGVSPDVLRAWERRYGLLTPDRSSGGFRLYSDADVARVRRVQALVADGLSIAEAARLTLAEASRDSIPTTRPTAADDPARAGRGAQPGPHEVDHDGSAARSDLAPPPSPTMLETSGATLSTALETYDEVRAQRALDELFVSFTPETVLRDVVLPELARIGQRWEAGDLDVAQEHFASNLLRGRLLAMARGWGMRSGPTAVLAAPAGEAHDLPLVIFGLALWRQGWRITFLGADTPPTSLRVAVEASKPDVVVLAAVDQTPFITVEQDLLGLARLVPVGIAGRGASREFAERIGAMHLVEDPITEAARLAQSRIWAPDAS